MLRLDEIKLEVQESKKTWLVTGCAGFIGSNILESLLKLNQKVIGLDNFSTGFKKNLDEIKGEVTSEQWKNFSFYEGDISDFALCMEITKGVDIVLHQAALGSVPRSINDPLNTNKSNITGFVNMLWACVQNKVSRFVYASSSSVYGDDTSIIKKENIVGNVLSPYAASKKMNEIYANVFRRTYGLETIGIRYFNVFGKRQSPNGVYAAVIPLWIKGLLTKDEIFINGDGQTSRDFCYVKNVIQMNLLCGLTSNAKAFGEVFNCAVSEQTKLINLFNLIRKSLRERDQRISEMEPIYRDFRQGDIRHSLADISKAQSLLDYRPDFNLEAGIRETLEWYVN